MLIFLPNLPAILKPPPIIGDIIKPPIKPSKADFATSLALFPSSAALVALSAVPPKAPSSAIPAPTAMALFPIVPPVTSILWFNNIDFNVVLAPVFNTSPEIPRLRFRPIVLVKLEPNPFVTGANNPFTPPVTISYNKFLLSYSLLLAFAPKHLPPAFIPAPVKKDKPSAMGKPKPPAAKLKTPTAKILETISATASTQTVCPSWYFVNISFASSLFISPCSSFLRVFST